MVHVPAAGFPEALPEVPPDPPVRYVGLSTRAIAIAIDAALINLVALVVGAGGALIVGILHLPSGVRTLLVALGGVAYVLWTMGYFIVFWSTTGQTLGSRMMRMRVIPTRGEKLKPRRALLRCIGVVLAALPLFAGFLLILFDSRRRGLQDRIARTLVIEAPEISLVEQRRRQKRQTSVLPRTGQLMSNSPGIEPRAGH